MSVITKVDFVGVPSTDWRRSRAFYVETLGLRPDETGDAEFWVGETCFGIYEPTTFGLAFAPQTTAHLALRVADVAAARTDLEAKGVEFDGETFDTGVCHMAFFQRSRRQRADAAPPLRAAGLMQVERVDFVDVPTRDVERSIAFYRDVLELPQNPREPTEFETGNVTLAIWKPEEQGVEFASGASHGIALRVADVSAARAELEAKGVEFVGERDSGVCHMAFFNDPDGNSLILHRRYAP